MTEPANRPSHGISRTSIFVAAGRAVGAGEPDPSVRNPDYLAGKFLGDPSTLDLDHPAVRALGLSYDDAMKDAEIASNVRMMTIRTRFIDDAVERATAGGARQVVILGAGFDSHACRCGELLAPVRVFEVDQRQMAYQLAEAVVAPRVDIPLPPFSRDETSSADFADEIRQG